MGRQSGNIYRLTISIPVSLKERMDRLTNINWSAIAASAFENKLGEIAAAKAQKEEADIVQRLRASRLRAEDEHFRQGERLGRKWAADTAETAELERLEDYSQSEAYVRNFGVIEGADTWAERLFSAITPELGTDEDQAERFWVDALGDKFEKWPSLAFLQGFVHGALELWGEVKDQL